MGDVIHEVADLWFHTLVLLSHPEEPPSAVLAELERRLCVGGFLEKASRGIKMTDCLFCNIRDGGIPADIICEDDDCMAFRDINPKAPVHFLVIPRRHMENLFDATPSDEGLLGRIQLRIQQIAKEQGLDSGFRTVLNTGLGGHQEVYHMHYHVLGVWSV